MDAGRSFDVGGDLNSTPSPSKIPSRNKLVIPESLRVLTDPRQNVPVLSTALASGLKLPQISPDTTERVFPIRSVVSIDSSAPSSTRQTPSLESSEWLVSPMSDASWGFSAGENRSRSHSRNIWDVANRDLFPDHCPFNLTDSLQSFATGRDGFCAEPIQTGIKENIQHTHKDDRRWSTHRAKERWEEIRRLHSVYSFGVLLALRESEGKLVIEVSSRNSEEVIGHTPEELFSLSSFCDILRQDKAREFLSHTRSIRDRSYSVEQHGPDVIDLTISAADGKANDFWCTIHATEDGDSTICEIEPQRNTADIIYQNDVNQQKLEDEDEVSRKTNEEGSDTSTAMRVFAMLRESKSGFEYSSILNAVSRVIQLTSTAESIDILFDRVIKILRELTGFHKVTVYRFDSDWNDIAVADLEGSDTSSHTSGNMNFLGSVFSESFRTLHLRNKVRVSYNHKNHSPAELVYRESNAASQLDTNFCYLSMGTPAPLELLSATPVEACVSLRINVFGKLWGLVSCKSYDEGARLLPPLIKICSLISDALSSNIERLSYTLPFQVLEKERSPQEAGKSDAAPAVDIVSLFGADYAASSIAGETKILGKPLDSQEVLALVEYLRMRGTNTILWSTDISNDFQDLIYPPGFKYISCLLFIPLSADGRDFIIFFRTSHWCEVTRTSHLQSGPENCATGADFPQQQRVLRRPDGWSAVDLGKASVLSLVYKTFAEVWQQKETAMQNSQLMRLLLANCAHEFRTPLNAIINYLEIALDGSLSQETRDNLSRSHSASKSLIYIINDLLDLTNTESGQGLIKDEIFDLASTIGEATHIFGEEAKQKKVDLQMVQHTKLPLVLGDQRRVRQVITNLISNAIQHTSNGSVVIESSVSPRIQDYETVGIEVAIHDTGTGMSQEAVEALFCELEEVSNDEYLQSPKCCQSKVDDITGERKNVLGLGLALVARIVRNMEGRLAVKSEKGVGSCFKIKLRFPLPSQPDDRGKQTGNDRSMQEDQHYISETRFKPLETRCDSECSSRYGESIREENTDVNISIAMDTGSSQFIFNSDTKFTKQQNEHMLGSESEAPSTPTTPKPTTAMSKPSAMQDNEQTESTFDPTDSVESLQPRSLHVLVAEDDPINSAIAHKRLEKLGHTVHLTTNGKQCATAYQDNPSSYDAMLMDIQMPIVDGINATKMIREYEASQDTHVHIPIFAVSASLMEKDRQLYIDGGFDGWMLKPIDFQRANHLLTGVYESEAREDSGAAGTWEKGGWFG